MPIFIHIPPEDVPSPERQSAFQERIDAVRQHARRVTEWERGFLDSIEAPLTTHRALTRGQREKLPELYTEHVDPDDDFIWFKLVKHHYVPTCYLRAFVDPECPPEQEPYVCG